MYSCQLDLIVSGSRVTTVCSTNPSSMCFSCFLHPSKDESAVLSRRSLFVSIQTRISVGTLFLLFAACSVYLIVKLSGLGTSSRLTVHWAVVAGFAVRSVVVRSRQCVYSFDLNVSLCQHTLLFLGQLHHLLFQSVMRGTDLRHALICIGELMSQRITVSGHCCQLLCHAGKLRSWSFHASAGVGAHWQPSSWDITICSDRALCEFTVDVLGWMSVHDCGLVDDQTVATFGNITAALGHSLPITVCTRTLATMHLHPSFLLTRRANVAEETPNF